MHPTLLLSLPLLLAPQDANWPSFRGPRAAGVSEEAVLPVEWDVPSGEGVQWRVPVPGLAHSSPVVWGDRVFVTTAVKLEGEAELSSLYGSPGYGAGESVADEGAHAFRLLAFDLASGELLWERTCREGVPRTKRHPKSTHANPTPACDAERVVAFFGSEGLYAFDHDGEPLWSRDLGVLDAGAPDAGSMGLDADGYQWGFASSPVLEGDTLLLQCDVQDQSYVAALDAATGETRWRVDRDENPTWCTPTVAETSATGEPQVLLNGYKHIGGYDLATGKELWKLSGGGDVPVPAPVVAHGMAFFTSAHGRLAPLYAVDLELAEGELSVDPEACDAMAWYHARRGVYMQTPLVYGTELYACSDGGILGAFDAGTGEMLYRERVGDGLAGFSASPVAAGGHLYLTAEDGTVHVVRAGFDFEVVARNDLGETTLATPAIAGDRLLFRTQGHLVAVGVDE